MRSAPATTSASVRHRSSTASTTARCKLSLWSWTRVEPAAQAKGTAILPLAGKVKDGDEVRYRVKVADNRKLNEPARKIGNVVIDAAKLDPNVVYHPADRWRALKVTCQADPNGDRDILAQRDSINQKIEAIKKEITNEKNTLNKLYDQSKEQKSLKPEQVRDLQKMQKEHEGIKRQLEDVAKDAEQLPSSNKVSDLARDVATKEIPPPASRLLKEAEKKDEPIRARPDAQVPRSTGSGPQAARRVEARERPRRPSSARSDEAGEAGGTAETARRADGRAGPEGPAQSPKARRTTN